MNTEKEQKKHDATTKQAAVLIAWYHWCIVRNIGKGIDRIVRKYPWQSIVTTTILTIALSMLISFIFISKARAERQLQQKLSPRTDAARQLQGCVWRFGKGGEVI